jgi:hypothetical protein
MHGIHVPNASIGANRSVMVRACQSSRLDPGDLKPLV